MKLLVLTLLLGATLTHAMPTPAKFKRLAERAQEQDLVCGVERIEEALLSVPEERPSPCSDTRCEPKLNDNIHTQADIVDFYREVIVTEGMIDEHSSPESLVALLEVINSTLPTIRTSVTESCYSDFSPFNITSCPSDASFRPKCTFHMMRTDLQHLLSNTREYELPDCSFCKQLAETNQRDVDEFPGMVVNLIRSLVPSTCRRLFAAISTSSITTLCNDVYELHKRLENLTLWQNVSLSSINAPLPEVTEVIERLRETVLPVTANALEVLKQEDDCRNVQRDQCVDLPTPEQITSVVESALLEGNNHGCDIEPDVMVVLQILNLIQYNSHFFNSRLQDVGIL